MIARVILLAILLVAPVFGAALAQDGAIATITRVQGQAALLPAPATVLAPGDNLAQGSVVTTGPGARLELAFIDGTVLTLGERAQLAIDAFVYDPQASLGMARLNVAEGAFRVVSGGIGALPDKNLRLITPLAVIGLRGTDFWGGPLYDPMNVVVLDGAVFVETLGGSVVIDQPGQATAIAAPGEAPSAPTVWSAEQLARAVATISFTP